MLVALCVALMGVNAQRPLVPNIKISVKYLGLVMPSAYTSGGTPDALGATPPASLVAGQDARFRVTLVANTQGNHWASIYFNATAGSAKVRIIPAFSSRGTTGDRIKCNAHTDYFQEYWGLTASSYQWGHAMVTQAYVTYTVPPFPYRVCYQAVASYRNATMSKNATFYSRVFRHWREQRLLDGKKGGDADPKMIPADRFVVINTTYERETVTGVWSDFSNMQTSVQYVNASAPYTWTSSSTMYADDFAAIKIQQNGYQHDLYIPASTAINTGDIVKIVPGGFPCTYEHVNQRDYCSYRRVSLKGTFHESCVREGSIQHGIPRIGSNQKNPYSLTSVSATTLTLTLIKGGEDLVAYAKLPAAGTYDICFSPKAMRTFNATNYITPVFYKIFKQDTSCSGIGATAFKSACRPTTRLIVAANADTLRWTTPHIYPASWGALKIYEPAGTTSLNTGKATSWEHSSTREFFTTVGGDQFRLVSTDRWTTTAMTYGDMYLDSAGNRFKTTALARKSSSAPTQQYTEFERISTTATGLAFGASGDTLTVRAIGKPDQGSLFSLSSATTAGGGCWYWIGENYGNYDKGLNGINSAMNSATTCCSKSATTGACTSATYCSMSDSDNDGVTASADLGADPRLHAYAWTFNAASQSQAWAYIRFPVSKKWNVCYRKVGTENWRVIKNAATSLGYFDPNDFQNLNYTYHVNDSQATTWGPLTVRDPQKTLTTQNHNYVSAATTVVGSAVKIVKYLYSCYTDNGESETFDSKPGLKECEVGACSGAASCSNCAGHSDDSTTARWEVTFYVRMPAQLASGSYYRVCFKNGQQNWLQLQDPKYISHSLMTSPWKFNSRPAPQMDFTLMDWREGTWGKFLFRRLANPDTQAFNIDANNAFGSGDVVRLVQNRTSTGIPVRCDTTWGATSSNGEEFVLQNFVPAQASWNLGIYCISTSATTTSKCFTGNVSPSDSISSDVGTYPYTNVDSTADGSYISDFATQGAVAFITIPPKVTTGTAGYRLCYKPQASNWIEVPKIWNGAPNPFVVGTKPTLTFSVGGASGTVSTPYAGSWGYLAVSGGTIDLDKDVVKLVLNSLGGCDRPAAGQQSPGNTYASFSWRKLSGSTWTEAGRGGQAFVSASAVSTAQAAQGSRGTVTSARAYMTFPTVAGLSAVTTNYKVCYMTRDLGSSDTANWQHLGNINVYSPGIAYTAETQPYNGGVMGIRFVTAGTIMLNTLPMGDAAKIVSITSPCYGTEWASTNRPNGVTSTHVGQETNYVKLGLSAVNNTLLETGNDDLGDSNLAATTMSRMDVTLPWSATSTATYYKVCYRPLNHPWIELMQAPLANQKYALGASQLYTSDASLDYFFVSQKIVGVVPFTSGVYATGTAYDAALVGGAATAMVSTSNTSYLYVNYKVDWTTNYAKDTFKIVKYSDEVVRGQYENIPNINCNSPGEESTPGAGSTASTGSNTKSGLAVNLPVVGGRYLLCYKKFGLPVWIQLEPSSTTITSTADGGLGNPFKVIPNALSFTYNRATGNFSITDKFSALISSVEYALGSVSSYDKIYIVNASDACGIAHSYAWDPAAPTSTTSLAANIDNAPVNLKGTSNVTQQATYTAPTKAGYYKVCYQRTSTTTMATTTVSSSKPFTPTTYTASVAGSWYQVSNDGLTTNGGGTPFYVTATASRLQIAKCPQHNASNPIRTGMPIDLKVSVLDAENKVLPFSIGTWAYLIEAVDAAAPTAATFSMQNEAGTCRGTFAPTYGWAASNLKQYTAQGVVTYSLAIVSGCPTGGCSITFTASDSIKGPGGANTLTDPKSCTLHVRTTSVNSMSIWEGPTTCKLDESCKIRVAAYWTDGGLAHTATDDVMMTATGITGISVKANGVALSETTSAKAGKLASGFFEVTVVFDATSGALFTANTAVTLKFSSASKNASHTITVIRPILNKMYIVDVYPSEVVVDGLTDNDKFVRPSMIPTWEPTSTTYSYFMGMVAASQGSNALSAATGYHLVAMQAYTVVLRPVDSTGEYINKVTLLENTKHLITIENTASAFSGNKILRPCTTAEVCNSAFSGTTLSSVSQKVTFSLLNSKGCTRATGCTLTFKFAGADLTGGATTLTTPVRSMATKLDVTCWKSTATTESGLGAGSTTCPSTTPEVGLALKVKAVDANGDVDEYFEGNVLPLLKGGNGKTTKDGINLTTVAALQGTGAATIDGMAFVQGVKMIYGLTLTRACPSGCDLQLVTDWGTALYEVGAMVVTSSTTKLQCTLSSTLYACVVNTDGNCESISGYFGYDTAQADNNKKSLIYKDTEVCATVTAVNKDGLTTLYETNWVTYWAQATAVTGTTIAPVTITDSANAAASRVKAMVRSSVKFCFKVNSAGNAKANFKVRFAAQRFNDATYWARSGTNGECELGIFSFWSTKHIANVVVNSVDQKVSSLTTLPASSVNLFAQRADASTTDVVTKIIFGLWDHYGKTITNTEVTSFNTASTVVIDKCSMDDTAKALASTCTTSSIGSTSNIAMTVPSAANQREGGVVDATLTASSIQVSSATISYDLKFTSWCLGCSLTFTVKTASGDYKTKYPGATDYIPKATTTLYILIMDKPSARLIAFKYGTSPFTSYWQKFDTTNTAPTTASSGVTIVTFKSTCFTTDKTTCSPTESFFTPTVCDEQTATNSARIASDATGTAIQLYVLSATSTTGATDTTSKEPSCNAKSTCTAADTIGQVDILNSWTIDINIGSQTLQCSGTACTDDLTAKPKQNVEAFGTTATDAATAFAKASNVFRTTSFVVSGVTPSAYYVIASGKLSETVTPSLSSQLTISATSNNTAVTVIPSSLTSTYNFVFKGPKIAAKFAILDAAKTVECPTKPKINCHGGSGCGTYTGYQLTNTLDSIAYKYAYASSDAKSIVPINTEIPISADVQDANSVRVASAAGTVTIELYSWNGCNNGGTMTVKGAVNNKEVTMNNGRITAYVSFSAPCESCVLRFVLTPSSTQTALYKDLNTNIAMLTQYSKPINVRDNLAGTATHLLATSLPADQKASVTVADVIQVNMIPVGSIGATQANYQVADKFATGVAYAYNVIKTSSNPFWYGNGGVLRKDIATPVAEHHNVMAAFASTGAVGLKFSFTRTCPDGCEVIIAYSVNGNLNSFKVQNADTTKSTTFYVTAASTKYMLVGYRPRMVQQNTDFALSVWHVGAGAGEAFVGVGDKTMSPATATSTVEDSVNGDGGAVMDQAFTLTKTEIHRVKVPRVCNRLRINVGSDNTRLNVYTAATTLRVDRPIGAMGLYQVDANGAMSGYASYGVFAVDDLGFIDVRQGGYSGGGLTGGSACFAYDPLTCPSSPSATLSVDLSANGMTAGGFMPTDSTFLAAGATAGTFATGKDKMVDGQAKDVQVTFTKPARNAYPLFKVGSLTSSTNGLDARKSIAEQNVLDISVGKTGLNMVALASATSVAMYSSLSLEVGLVKLVADAAATSPTSYIAVEADNEITATYSSDCPARSASAASAPMRLMKGYLRTAIRFTAPTASGKRCVITFAAGAGAGVCTSATACQTTVSVTVTSVTVSKWFWIAPSVLDNAPGLPAGPFFGAMGRKTTFAVGVQGMLDATTSITVTSCDDPSTSTVETCKLSVTVDATCAQLNAPTIGTDKWNTTSGIGSIDVTWATSGDGKAYTCKLAVSVVDGSSKALTVDGTPGANVEVSVCKPTNLVMVTNSTTEFKEMFLRSGAPYSFKVAITDANGVNCRGDSGASASELAVSLVGAKGATIESMGVYNTNMTHTAVDWTAPNPQTAKAVGGQVTFTLYFTNSSVNLGLGGFRVKVTSSSMSSAAAYSGSLDTVIAASTIRFHPMWDLPLDWVMGRQMEKLVAQAVDGLDPRLVKKGPNVARKPNEVGNDEAIAWQVDPLPSTGFPLSFSTGSKETTMNMGEATFVATFNTARDGNYALSLITAKTSKVMGSKPFWVNFQTVKDVMIDTMDVRHPSPTVGGAPRVAPATVCNSNCMLSNRSFQLAINGTEFLNTTMLREFNVSIVVADGQGQPVKGENVSFIMVRMVKPATSTSTVALTLPPAYTAKQTAFWAKVQYGRTRFSLGFIGSTMEKGSTTHTHVTLEFSCPATVPAAIAGTTADITNPCSKGISRSTATTMAIQVIDPSVPATVFNSAAVQAARPVVRIPTNIKSLAAFNVTDFKLELAKRLGPKFPFINKDNANVVIEVNACEVMRATFGNADLGSSVCGAQGKCSGTNTQCPVGVVKCTCNSAAALSALLGRYLLQTTGAEVQVEATFNLQKAPGFSANSEAEITNMYQALGESTVSIVKTDTSLAQQFGIDTANVGTRSATAPVQSQTPVPTPNPPPPPTPAPTPPPPTTVTPAPSSANSLRVSMTTVLAALLMLALFW